jgi:hypothetical protein
VRTVSTFAPQALILLNGNLMQKASKQMAIRLLKECGCDVNAQIDRAYELTLARKPSSSEMATGRDFLNTQIELLRDRLRARLSVPLVAGSPEGTDPAVGAALADFCLALFNSNAFLYVD